MGELTISMAISIAMQQITRGCGLSKDSNHHFWGQFSIFQAKFERCRACVRSGMRFWSLVRSKWSSFGPRRGQAEDAVRLWCDGFCFVVGRHHHQPSPNRFFGDMGNMVIYGRFMIYG